MGSNPTVTATEEGLFLLGDPGEQALLRSRVQASQQPRTDALADMGGSRPLVRAIIPAAADDDSVRDQDALDDTSRDNSAERATLGTILGSAQTCTEAPSVHATYAPGAN